METVDLLWCRNGGRGQITIAKLHGPLNATLINCVKTMTPSYRPADTLRSFDDVKGSRVARLLSLLTRAWRSTMKSRCKSKDATRTRHDRSKPFCIRVSLHRYVLQFKGCFFVSETIETSFSFVIPFQRMTNIYRIVIYAKCKSILQNLFRGR